MNTAFLFYGDDDYTITKTVQKWCDLFIAKHSEVAINRLDAENDAERLEPELATAANTQSLFATLNLIILTNPFSISEEPVEQKLISLIETASADTHVIILWQRQPIDKRRRLYKQLLALSSTKKLEIKEFREPKGDDLERWIRHFYQQRQVSIDDDALNLLRQRSLGLPLWTIAQRCELLTTVTDAVTAETVKEYIPPLNIADTFGITDALAARNLTGALKRGAPLLLARNPKLDELIPSFGAVAWLYRTLLLLKEQGAEAEINPYVQRKLQSLVGRWTLTELKQGLIRTAELDWAVKTGKSEYQWAIEELIFRAES
ncbi:MAG: DNA polymerase III subunit delta [bacterium]|nr:DNA polymerase III subunit delta [bacterium]